MGRWARWTVVGVVAIIALIAVYGAWTARQRRLKQKARDAVYAARIDEIRKTYPRGTPRAVVEKGLGMKPWSDPRLVEEELVLGQDPSPAWTCSTLDNYAVFMFEQGPDRDAEPLVSVELEQHGGDCM